MKPSVKIIKSERKSISVDFPYGKRSFYKNSEPYMGKVIANINSKTTRISLRFVRENETIVLTPLEAHALAVAIDSVVNTLTAEDLEKGSTE